MPSTEKSVVLITGCSSGIGRALTEELARRGRRVYATARRLSAIEDLKKENVSILPLDVTDAASRQAAVEAVLRESGRIDMLINNAGYGLMSPVADLTDEDLRKQFDTNVIGAMALARAVFPHMAARRTGMIVNVGSVSGILISPFAGAYCASKAALHALSDVLRIEAAPFGVKVVCVQPGAVLSRFGDNAAGQLPSAKNKESLYTRLMEAVEKRARISQTAKMTSEQFAAIVVEKILRPEPPRVIRAGDKAMFYVALGRLLPASLLDAYLSKQFGLTALRK